MMTNSPLEKELNYNIFRSKKVIDKMQVQIEAEEEKNVALHITLEVAGELRVEAKKAIESIINKLDSVNHMYSYHTTILYLDDDTSYLCITV